MMRLCLIGHPVKHSLSPPMHRAAFLYFGIDGTYELIDIEPESLSENLPRLTQEYSGFNVTIPHKEAVFQMLPNRSTQAHLVGAVNTVRVDSAAGVYAHNTDMQGFMNALARGIQTKLNFTLEEFLRKDKTPSALVLGAGGAARACLAGLALSGFRRVYLWARRPASAVELLDSMNSSISAYLQREFAAEFLDIASLKRLPELNAVVNCTAIGLSGQDENPEWSKPLYSQLCPNAFFFDTVYRRDQGSTLLMKEAARCGVPAVDGLGMLTEQAALAFEFWTGRLPAVELLQKSLSASNV